MNIVKWLKVNIKLIICGILFIGGIAISSSYGNIRHGNLDHRIIAFIGVIIFLIFSIAFLNILTNTVTQSVIVRRLGMGRTSAIQFILRLIGYLIILFTALSNVGVPVGHILLGSAVLGIILGVAAQQALGNFFAGIVLIVTHPFTVGEHISIISGALGGKYKGNIIDIGLTHTRLQEDNGQIVDLPNSTILAGSAIIPQKHESIDKD